MQPRIYRMAPELRRSAIYGMIGCTLLAVAAFWIGYVLLERDLSGLVVCCTLLAILAAAMILPVRWALHVDDFGVARRWLIGWGRWSWSDFASGRVAKVRTITFINPQRSGWLQTLNIEFVADAERRELIQLINRHYRLPDPPTVPESIQIGFGFRRKVDLLPHEVRYTVRGESRSYVWRDVERLRITRVDPLRRDFVYLSLSLPGHEIELGRQGGHGWSGGTAEELNEFLSRHVPAGRIDVDIVGERPHRAEDVQKELSRRQSMDHQMRICLGICGLLLAGALIWMAVESGLLKPVLMGSLYLVWFGPVYWFLRRRVRERTTELERWLAELECRRE